MVVLSAAVLGRHGKVLVARQFVEMSRSRIEGLLAAFPKLLSGQDKSRQHTFVETGSVRYVYFPTEGMHVVLITTKGSNIVEDLATLQLVSKCVPEFGMSVEGDVSEATVMEHAFEIICAFDEAISAGGQAEQVTLDQIRTFMEMDSAEERLQLMLKKSRMEAAASARKSAEQDIARSKRQGGGRTMGGVGSHMGGVGSDGFRSGGGGGVGGVGSGGGRSSGGGRPAASSHVSSRPARAADPPSAAVSAASGARLTLGGGKGKRAGLSLGGGAKGADSALREMGIGSAASGSASAAGAPSSAEAAVEEAAARAAAAVAAQVDTAIVETVSCTLDRDGGMQSLEVAGDLTVRVNDPAAASASVACAMAGGDGFRFQTHPRMDKAAWSSGSVLATSKPFPVGGKGARVLRWRMSTKDISRAPVQVTCWPDPLPGGRCQVSVEYSEMEDACAGIAIGGAVVSVPLPPGPHDLEVLQAEGGTSVDGDVLRWRVPASSGEPVRQTLEFVVNGASADAFFPVGIDFEASGSFSGISVVGVTDQAGAELRSEALTQVRAQGYVVE